MSDTMTFAPADHIGRDYEKQDAKIMTSKANVNVGETERWVSLLAGGFLLVKGLQRGGMVGLTMAGTAAGLLFRGTTGRCHIYDALNVNTATMDDIGVHVEQVVTINRSAEDLFHFWRNFENLPRFMHHLESVEIITDKISRWTAHAPAGFTVTWEAEIVTEEENKGLMWRSLENAQISHAGSVQFTPAPGGRGTEVRVSLSYNPPAGSVGLVVAKLFGEEPSQQVAKDLQRFKNLMEAGEIPTTQGQSAGPSMKRRLKSALMPSAVSSSNGKEPGVMETDNINPKRRWLEDGAISGESEL